MNYEEFKKEIEEDRKIRKESAKWNFIKNQPLRIKKGLEALIESGDLWVASRIAGITLDEMNDIRIRADIPMIG
ncbi:MAG: hypothetical protein CVT88_04810 [Candidatus Altiarchaeales archaeon HGW-Altiarchaeales-1]|nr:MAG: hypothetical protein CVT89_08850 [Candidatus Altiarchaeales archaeon HGW-Altiarchaeales-2]PKP59724.1 MAG: hypothetical protein CVT88_04810 [Candidatus Altiarchaeales archaeon HGW-Altiarchaeales-1]